MCVCLLSIFIESIVLYYTYIYIYFPTNKGRTAGHVAMIRGNETGVLTAMEAIDASSQAVNSGGGGGGVRGSGSIGGVSEVGRSNFSRMLSQRGSDISLELNGSIVYDDELSEVDELHHTNTPSTASTASTTAATSTSSDSSDVRTSLSTPKRPSHNPPAPPRIVPQPWQVVFQCISGPHNNILLSTHKLTFLYHINYLSISLSLTL
jgi:hypothetical protein